MPVLGLYTAFLYAKIRVCRKELDGGGLMSSVTFEHLTKTYPNGFVSVDDVNLYIEDGESVVFHGPSGMVQMYSFRMIGEIRTDYFPEAI